MEGGDSRDLASCTVPMGSHQNPGSDLLLIDCILKQIRIDCQLQILVECTEQRAFILQGVGNLDCDFTYSSVAWFHISYLFIQT